MTQKDRLLDDVFRYRRAVLLLSAARLGLWEYMGGREWVNLQHVTRHFGWTPRAAEIMLNALCSLNYLEKKAGKYRLVPQYRQIFSGENYRYMKEWFHHEWRLLNRWMHLPDVLQTGQPYREMKRNIRKHNHRNFILSMAHREKLNLPSMLQAVPLDGYRHLLDVGGGPGLFAIGFAEKYTGLSVTVQDTPETESIARTFFRASSARRRLKFRGGDFLKDPLGTGYDAVLISSVLHIYSPPENLALLRKVFQSMSTPGKIIIRDFLMNPQKTGPVMASLFAVNMLINTETGNAYSAAEMKGWLKQAGFKKIRRKRLEGRMVLLEAEKTGG